MADRDGPPASPTKTSVFGTRGPPPGHAHRLPGLSPAHRVLDGPDRSRSCQYVTNETTRPCEQPDSKCSSPSTKMCRGVVPVWKQRKRVWSLMYFLLPNNQNNSFVITSCRPTDLDVAQRLNYLLLICLINGDNYLAEQDDELSICAFFLPRVRKVGNGK